MYGNPCLRAARKSKSGERVQFGQRQTTDALIGAIRSNAKRRQGGRRLNTEWFCLYSIFTYSPGLHSAGTRLDRMVIPNSQTSG
jgi:hypothetical protein